MAFLNRSSTRFHRKSDYHLPGRRQQPAVGERIELLAPDTRQSRRKDRPFRPAREMAT